MISGIIREIEEEEEKLKSSLKRLIAAHKGRALIANEQCRWEDEKKHLAAARSKELALESLNT